MFTIIISEKGGAERRETFDKNEINVGRVQGNDLMLPKGNVSKHHARLLFRDGRFIVTDLKSTNGTYVNGRKISQATIVREGDKIYIGDFVLRLETRAAAAAAEADAIRPGDDSQGRTPAAIASWEPRRRPRGAARARRSRCPAPGAGGGHAVAAAGSCSAPRGGRLPDGRRQAVAQRASDAAERQPLSARARSRRQRELRRRCGRARAQGPRSAARAAAGRATAARRHGGHGRRARRSGRAASAPVAPVGPPPRAGPCRARRRSKPRGGSRSSRWSTASPTSSTSRR